MSDFHRLAKELAEELPVDEVIELTEECKAKRRYWWREYFNYGRVLDDRSYPVDEYTSRVYTDYIPF